MARIRSIKPEFFTSKTIAALPWRTQITFIGLWTHCDDAGRCQDDATLIRAALFIRSDDVTDADVESDLVELEAAGLIVRYVGHYRGKERPLLAISSWTEHQQISRPSKSRIPAPDDAGAVQSHEAAVVTHANDMHSHVNDMSPPVIPVTGAVELGEQGSSGTGEQGIGSRVPRDANRLAQQLTVIYVELVPMSKFEAIQGVVKKALSANYHPDVIERALRTLAAEGRSVTVESMRVAMEGLPPRKSRSDEVLAREMERSRTADAARAQSVAGLPPLRAVES